MATTRMGRLLDLWVRPELLIPTVMGAVVMATGPEPFSEARTAWGLTVMGLGATSTAAARASSAASKARRAAGYAEGFGTYNPALRRPPANYYRNEEP